MTLNRPDLNSFEMTVAALFSRVRGHIEPGSHRMRRLLRSETLERLSTLPTILVGGTNGKGTLCSLIEKTLRDSNYKTALYTSPHLVSPTERIRINGIPISDSRFLLEAQSVFSQAQNHLADATFFELMTAMAFEYFCQMDVEVLVCEVGLGGRLDSTNITSPIVSVLTSVGLDHTEWLGSNEESIATEKAFISRRNRPLIIGRVSQRAKAGISAATAVTGAITHTIDSKCDKQSEVVLLAQSVIDKLSSATGFSVAPDQVSKSSANHFWPGRFDRRVVNSIPVVFDAAHNSHGILYFLNKLSANAHHFNKPWALVFASLADKDWIESINHIQDTFDAVYFTETLNPRAVKADLLMQHACSIGMSCSLSSHNEVSKALESGLEHTRAMNGTLFVLGSITLLGESFEHWAIPVFSEQDQLK